MIMMTYAETLDFLQNFARSGIKPGLQRIRTLLDAAGNPQQAVKMIHVAGTNGKGSVCAYLTSILRQAGYRVGRYISPTLYNYRERIQVDDIWISEKDAARLGSQMRDLMSASRAEDLPSSFEIETAMAFTYFKEKNCDFAVIEAGLGGREDATNVINRPVMTIITSISMDHTHFLGNTLESIAWHKGGIMKRGVPCLVDAGRPQALRVLRRIALEKDVPFFEVYAGESSRISADLLEGQLFSFRDFQRLQTSLPASYEIGNACLAAAAALLLDEKSIARISREDVQEGIRKTRWQDRFEVVCRHPLAVCDGAHNPAGAKALRESVDLYMQGRPLVLMTGIFKDKDYEGILRNMAGTSEHLITFAPSGPRGLQAEQLARCAAKYFPDTLAASSQKEAFCLALDRMDRDRGALLQFGSLSTAAGFSRLVDEFLNDH